MRRSPARKENAAKLEQAFVGIYFKKAVLAKRFPCLAPERLEV